jgi:DNA polymerase
MKSVVNYWAKLNQELVTACALGVPFELNLPSGRTLRYGKLRKMKALGDRFAIIGKIYRMGGMRDIKLYGGTLSENMSQGLARDIFSDMMLRIDAAGYPIILHVHDEVVCEVPEAIAEEALSNILKIMSTPPDWIADIPVAAEGQILDIYTK